MEQTLAWIPADRNHSAGIQRWRWARWERSTEPARKQLQDIGTEMIELKKKAPRKPAQPSALKKTIDAVIR